MFEYYIKNNIILSAYNTSSHYIIKYPTVSIKTFKTNYFTTKEVVDDITQGKKIYEFK